MKKIKQIGSEKIKKMVKESFNDEISLPEHKIDSIIRAYLLERNDILNDESAFEDKYEFNPKTKEILSDMIDNISEMTDDLEIIKEKEANVLVFNDVYADEYLEGVISELNDLMDDIKFLIDLKSNQELD